MKVNIASLVIGLALLGGCKSDYDAPCRDKVVKITNNFTTEQAAAIPYGKKDTVKFVSYVNDTLLLVTQFYQSAYSYLPSKVVGNPECPADLDAYQVLQVNLFDSITGIGFQSLWRNVIDSSFYTLSGKLFGMKITAIGGATASGYADSVVINQKVFYDVNTIHEAGGDSIIVNRDFGLVYFVVGAKAYRLESFNNR